MASRAYLRRYCDGPILPNTDFDAADDTDAATADSGSFLNHMWAEKNARKLAIFLVMNVSFMFAEVFYGWWTNSLGTAMKTSYQSRARTL